MAKKLKKKLPDIEIEGGKGIEIKDLIPDVEFKGFIDEEFIDEDMAIDIVPNSTPNLDDIEGRIQDIDDQPVFLKVLIYGDQGTGKTTVAATFPAPILFVDCRENGVMSIRGSGHKFLPAKSWDDLESVYWYLATREHPFKTVVIDTTTNAVDLGMTKVIEMDGYEGLPIRKHWGQLTSLAKTWFMNYRDLPMHVVFTAQLKRLDEEDLGSDETYTKVPMLSPAIKGALIAAVDIMGYTFIKEVTNTTKSGREKKSYSYRMRIGPDSSTHTKIRVRKGTLYPAVLKDPSFDQVMQIISKEG